jgi:hypothetical protein
MKKLLLIVGVAIVAYLGLARNHDVAISQSAGTGSQSEQTLARAFEDQKSNFQIEGRGIVTRVLADDVDGSRHQRFIIELDSGQTLLLTHNLDLARRIAAIREGDPISFNGEYEWNPEGGVIHWTHHDPDGQHTAGWIVHNGRKYQ